MIICLPDELTREALTAHQFDRNFGVPGHPVTPLLGQQRPAPLAPPADDQPAQGPPGPLRRRTVIPSISGATSRPATGTTCLSLSHCASPAARLSTKLRAARTGHDALIITVLDNQSAVTAIQTPPVPHLG